MRVSVLARPVRLIRPVPTLTRGIKIRSKGPVDKVDSPPLPFASDKAVPPKADKDLGAYSSSTIANEQGDYVNHLKDAPDVNKEAREADAAALKKEKK
ncbi:hypothetical protein CcaverHIS002_0102520 [Cutaneotrichosporon cavernicola]|uniref:Uncharacterized protein n=1 Tax=Cutaneotrichosporon cavernicola TaxID=279322 RepID=A0AA48IHT6_9TREE|nr:uncharacterized protein CcaverHIS019_0102460 [Cutaneotrichosporon cavernicola]BEI79723.1 hypothetical protein CcaverHIS002_0102520 [Cutaneotrichosporon cavernicola]BEI87528.1 hypothetical protein CcaverHIS019_0102460 [Cutaneotrichosporon cavernicola]BEI95299.1 hypothetical protein CcaverHIS631_0102480 [Cutaneotrichosporon cavernicola]BEJ03073.1 hypothetical protein CcaverHIS641_0102480 [Cutaneotrichosporon cavernicola]